MHVPYSIHLTCNIYASYTQHTCNIHTSYMHHPCILPYTRPRCTTHAPQIHYPNTLSTCTIQHILDAPHMQHTTHATDMHAWSPRMQHTCSAAYMQHSMSIICRPAPIILISHLPNIVPRLIFHRALSGAVAHRLSLGP